MIQLNLSKDQAEQLLVQAPDTPGLRDSYEQAKRTGFLPPQRMKFYMSDTAACGVVRADCIARAVNAYAAPHVADCKVVTTPSDIDAMTCAVVQRQREPKLANYIQAARKRGVKFVYDLDDDLFNVPKEFTHVYDMYCRPETRQAIKDVMRACDCVSVATEHLKDVLHEEVGDDLPVTVIPNFVDTGTWYPTHPAVESPVVVGWMASGTHAHDCEVMEPVMKAVAAEVGVKSVVLEVIGSVPDSLIEKWEIPYRKIPWVLYGKLPNIMSRWSIGLAPLRESRFNDGKSPLKALQYWSLGKPVVCSDSVVYRGTVVNGEDGFLCRTTDEWIDCLVSLVKSVDLRSRLGHNGYNKVVESFDLKDRVWDWISLAAH